MSRWHWWMIFPILGTIMGLMFAALPLWKMMRGPAPKPPRAAAPALPPKSEISEARRLALKAQKLSEGIDSTIDDFKTAEGLLQRAVTLDPTDGFVLAVYSRLNTGYAMRGFEFSPSRQEEARSQMERAIRLAPEEAEVWLARGSYLRRTGGERAEAEKALRKAIELAPQDTRPWFDLAWALGKPGENSVEVLAALDKSIDPARPGSNALAHYNQFLLLFGERRFAEADAKIRQSVSELPSANFVTGLVRSELTWKGDAAAAVAVLEKLPPEKRKETRSVWFAAYAYLLARQPGETLRALNLLPGDFIEDSFFSGPKAYWEGRAQQQLGNVEAARVAWETALAVSRREGPGRGQRGLLMQAELLASLDRPEEAMQAVHAYEQATTGGRKRGAQAWISSSSRVYVLLGRLDEAWPLIEADLKATGVSWPLTPALLKLDPVWDKIRGDARIQAILEKAEPIK